MTRRKQRHSNALTRADQLAEIRRLRDRLGKPQSTPPKYEGKAQWLIERLRFEAMHSQPKRRRPYAPVTVRRVDPSTLRESAM